MSQVLPLSASTLMELNSVHPLELLQQLSSRKISGHLQISSSAVHWSIYLDNGKVLYVTHSVEPFDRLYSRLRRLSRRVPTLTKELCEQIGSCFATAEKKGTRAYDYDALIWLHQQQYLSLAQVVDTLEVLSQEALEPLLLIQNASLVLTDLPENSQAIGGFNLSSLLRHCEQRLRGWQSSEVPVFSPYQRPYYVGHVTPKQPLPELNPKFCAMLKGLSIRHLAAMINRDELDLFRSLTPYIQEKVIYLREPQKPFDQLPKISASQDLSFPEQVQTAAPLVLPSTPPATKTYSIVCIDDSPTITSEINRFLGDGDYTVTAINNPVKAMMQVLRLKPNLILLDVGMPIIDGYELCRLLRKNTELKKIPIIMVTGHTGFLDRARATLVGASDYLTKPFTREGLLEVVQRNLNGK